MPVKKVPVAASSTVVAPTPAPATPAAPKKAATASAPAKAAAVAPVTVPAVAAETNAPTEVSNIDVLEKKVNELTAFCKEVQVLLKVVKKEFEKMKKTSEKAERKRNIARSTPSGFAKPTKISDELCDFLKITKGSELSRTEVTRHITKYVRENNLNKADNKRIIIPNAALRKLLNCKESDTISYFNLQKWLKHHFVKA
jgi:chromatin remodeling complex protein RSC6